MSEPEHVEAGRAGHCTAVERRAWVRYGTDIKATCRGAAGRKEIGWPARVRDVSAGGIGLLLRHRFRPGSYLAVELHAPSGGCLRLLAARVVHTTPLNVDAESCWLTGCLFAEQLSEGELEALLAATS